MTKQSSLTCKCGRFTMQVEGSHIASVECLCSSCRKAGAVLSALPGAPVVVDDKGATPFVMHRKDRVRILSCAEQLKEYQLSADAGTRRVIATCCNTPVFMEMKGGHWLSLYGRLWADGDRPPLEMRTMTADLEDPASLPNDVPNLKQQSLSFYGRLFAAWVRMGFRSPKIVVNGELNV
jgi:hypothetical protein